MFVLMSRDILLGTITGTNSTTFHIKAYEDQHLRPK